MQFWKWLLLWWYPANDHTFNFNMKFNHIKNWLAFFFLTSLGITHMKVDFPFVFYLHSILMKLDLNLRHLTENNTWIKTLESKHSNEFVKQHFFLLINSCVCFPLCHNEVTTICQDHSAGRLHRASFGCRFYIFFTLLRLKNKLSCPCARH